MIPTRVRIYTLEESASFRGGPRYRDESSGVNLGLMQHLLTPLPLVVASLLAIPVAAPASIVQVPEQTVHTDPGEIYVPLEFTPVVEATPNLETSRPTEWMEPVRRCTRRGPRRFCDGPRMVPVPRGEAATRATELGLGTVQAVAQLMMGRPESAWLDAAPQKTHARMRFPIDGGRIGRGVGYVRRAELRHRRHQGVDIGAPVGTPVRAVEDGLVAYADNGLRGYGNLVVLLHADGSSTFYAHLEAAYVFAGQRVDRGQTVGEVGTTGLAYGPHLHFEWRVNGRARNPARRFER